MTTTLPTAFPPRIANLTQAVETLEKIRVLGLSISDWTSEESTEKFGGRVAAILLTQARASHDAAHAVARDLERVLKAIGTQSHDLAVSASVMGVKIQTLVIDPVEEAKHAPGTTHGLTVNG